MVFTLLAPDQYVLLPFVDLQGIEPWSKHIRRKLSTCLFPALLLGK